MASRHLAPSTLTQYKRAWSHWLDFCAARNFPGLGAPFAAYEALFGAAWEGRIIEKPRPRGKCSTSGPLSWSHLHTVLKAAAWGHEAAGLVAAPYLPENADEFSRMCDGYRRRLAAHGIVSTSAKAAAATDVKKVLASDPAAAHDSQDVALAAVVFMSLETNLTWGEIVAITPDGVSTSPDGEVEVRFQPLAASTGNARGPKPRKGTSTAKPERIVRLEHRHAVPAAEGGDALVALVPSVCVACLVTDAAQVLEPRLPIACQVTACRSRKQNYNAQLRWGAVVRHLATGWPVKVVEEKRAPAGWDFPSLGAPSVIRWEKSVATDPWRLAGARLGVLFHVRPRGLAVASARARFAISWSVGLRSRSDAAQIRRKDVGLHADPTTGVVSVRLHIPRSKTDQSGRGATMTLAPTTDPGSACAAAVAWASVSDGLRDAHRDNPFFFNLTEYMEPRASEHRNLESYGRDLLLLQKRAGVSGLTPHSSRRGFAHTAATRGHDFDAIRSTMRLVSPKNALRYMADAPTHSQGAKPTLAELLANADSPPEESHPEAS